MSKKILLATRPLVPPWDEASKNFAYFLARSIDSPGLSLHLLTERGHSRLSDLPQSVVEHPLYPAAIDGRAGFPFFQKIRLPIFLARHAQEFDVIHFLFTPAKLNTLINRFLAPRHTKTIQTIATVRDDLYTPKELGSLFFADHLVVYTERSKHKLAQLGFTNITRIYPGIDLERYQPQEKNPDILRLLGFDENHFIVIYPGEYMRLGATDMLTEAWIGYFQHHPDTDIRFVFACRVKNAADAAKKEAVKKRFADAGVASLVAFTDTIADMPGLYHSSDLVIFPVADLKGKFDVPLIIIEAYACGKSVILSDLEQFREFSGEKICVTIPKDSGERLIESVVHLRDNPAVRASIGQQARAFVEQNFDLKETAKQYEEIYALL